MIRPYRLTNEPGGTGLSCTTAGLSLAGVPLLRKTEAGFVPRAEHAIRFLIKAAYGPDVGASRFQASLRVVADALNRGDLARATMAAVLSRMPELTREAADRLMRAEKALAKYDFNADEPRNRHGQWTTVGDNSPENSIALGASNDNAVRARERDTRTLTPNNETNGTASQHLFATSDETTGNRSTGPNPLEQFFREKYDNLDPVDFSKQATRFGDWLASHGKSLSPTARSRALAEYNFVQNRLSFWLTYDNKPAAAHLNLVSAADLLFQGAIIGGIVQAGQIPPSMLDVAGAAWGLEGGRVHIPSARGFNVEIPAPAEELEYPERPGAEVRNGSVGTKWGKGIDQQGINWEHYLQKPYKMIRLPRNAKTFDFFDPSSGKAMSAKTMNTQTFNYINSPQKVYQRLKGYIDAAANYDKPRTRTDLQPAAIKSKEIQLAVPEYTSRAQWLQLFRAIRYGKRRGVSLVVTSIRD